MRWQLVNKLSVAGILCKLHTYSAGVLAATAAGLLSVATHTAAGCIFLPILSIASSSSTGAVQLQ
jgi:hypothetical protein